MTGSAWPRRAWPEMIRAGTQLRSVPLIPDIRLHLAGDPVSLWQRTKLTSGRTGLDPPFWAFAWAGGLALARYLLDHPETVRGRHAIDIASGSGVVAIAAAMAGAAAVDGAYAAAIKAGGVGEGEPADRTYFAAGYYAAIVADFDGNHLEFVHKGWNPAR